MHFKGLTLLSFFVLSFGTFASGKRSDWFPKQACRQLWSQKPKEHYMYQFANDSRWTDRGNEGYENYHRRIKRKNCYKEWTVLVFMAADNDLTPYALWDLYEMERQLNGEKNLGTSTVSTDVIVELDTYARTGVRRYHMFQTHDTYNPHISLDDFNGKDESIIQSPIIKWYKEVGGGTVRQQKNRFKRFIRQGIRDYPSQHYMLVIWGHGEGYIGEHTEKPLRRQPTKPRQRFSRFFSQQDIQIDFNLQYIPKAFSVEKVFGGVAFDFSEMTYLDIPSVRQIINQATDEYLDKKPLDILALDACLMQSIEVAMELQDSAQFIIGSTQIQNYLGLPYRKLFDAINSHAQSLSPFQLAREIPGITRQAYLPTAYQGQVDPNAFKSLTISALSTAALKYQLLPQLRFLARDIQAYFSDDTFRKEEIGFILQNSPRFPGETKDLGLFVGALNKLTYEEEEYEELEFHKYQSLLKLRERTLKVKEVIGATLFAYQFGPYYYAGPKGDHNSLRGWFKGLSIWLPSEKNLYEARIKEFTDSQFYINTGSTSWSRWIKESLSQLPF